MASDIRVPNYIIYVLKALSEAGFEGYSYTIGAAEGTETESLAHSKPILLWGANPLTRTWA